MRTWSDRSGLHRREAAFVEFKADAARLRNPDGRFVSVPIDRLSEADRAYLRRRAAHAEPATWAALFTGPGEGLLGEYFTDTSFDELGISRTDPSIDFKFLMTAPYTGGKPVRKIREGWYEDFAVRWTGLVVPEYSERYSFHLEVDDGGVLWVGDQLLVNSWKWQNATEYGGQIDLVAGRPYPVKLLYYNGPYGGSVKLSWSSPSRPKQVIPPSALFLPFREEITAPAGLPPLAADRVQVDHITLPQAVKNNPQGNKPSLILVPLASGGYKLGWNDLTGKLHISTLSADLQLMGKDVTIPDVDLRGLVVNADQSMALLAAQLPDRMWAMKLSPQGKLVFRTILVGEKGRGDGQHFLDDHFSFTGRFAAAGDQYAIHFAHSLNTGKGGVHQGGYYGLLDAAGKIISKNEWTVSHSLDQRLLHHRSCFITLSAGDCYPKGLWFENRTLGVGRIIYPAAEKREAFGNCGGFVNAVLGSMVPIGPDIAISFTTKDGPSREAVYMRLAEDGAVLDTVVLTDTPETEEQVVKLAPFDGQLLLVTRGMEKPTRLALIDHHGNLLTEPLEIDHSVPQNDDLLSLPSGDVGWLNAKDGDVEVRFIRIRADVPATSDMP